MNNFSLFEDIMLKENLSELAINTFKKHYSLLLSQKDNFIYEKEISPVETLDCLDDIRKTLAGSPTLKTAVIKLNGGLGTSMGMEYAKSLILAKNNMSFLEIILRQAAYGNQTLILMESFATFNDCKAELFRLCKELNISMPFQFLQNKVPKILKDSLLPAVSSKNTELQWTPPGHGDIYASLLSTGLLDELINSGVEYIFISNADNLGAVTDEAIPVYMRDNNIDFLMEVCERQQEDKKGGHLAKNQNGALLLREIAQCSPDEVESFQNITKYRYFNTNSIWINLTALKQMLKDNGGIMDLPLIRNEKNLNPRDPASPKVYQLETAMGSAILLFKNAKAISVDRNRFRPIKTTNDLLLIYSDIYNLNEKFVIEKKKEKIPFIDLDPLFFKTTDQINKHFPEGIPSLKNCDSLKVYGDIVFPQNIKLCGNVTLKNKSKKQVRIEENTDLLEENIIEY